MNNTETVTKDDYNPYQAPEQPAIDVDPALAGPEHIRREHISHEASVKSIGSLYLIIGSVITVPSVGMMIGMFGTGMPGETAPMLAYLMTGLGIAALGLAYAIHRLNRWARVICAFLSAVGMLFVIPYGALLNGYVIYLLYSRKGNVVFSDEYKEVIRQTPHIHYKSSGVLLIFFFALLLFVVGGVYAIWRF